MFAELAATAASALAGSVATDAWGWAKGAMAALFNRGGTPDEAVGRWLDATEAELTASPDPALVERAQSRWSTRLEDLLEARPELEGELIAFVERLSASGTPSQGAVFQQATANGQAQQAVLGHGTQKNTFNAAP